MVSARRLTFGVEAVEKVPEQNLGRDAEKSDPRKHRSHSSKGLFRQAR